MVGTTGANAGPLRGTSGDKIAWPGSSPKWFSRPRPSIVVELPVSVDAVCGRSVGGDVGRPGPRAGIGAGATTAAGGWPFREDESAGGIGVGESSSFIGGGTNGAGSSPRERTVYPCCWVVALGVVRVDEGCEYDLVGARVLLLLTTGFTCGVCCVADVPGGALW